MKYSQHGRPFLFAAAAALALLALPAMAQETRATLVGIVVDPSGAAVPKATVVVTGTETHVVTRATTNDTGSYQVPFLLPGEYSLTVEASGFRTFERSPITLRVADRTRVDVTLQIGQATDKITVNAEAPLLEVASSDRGQVIGNLDQLPVKNNNPTVLINFASGVSYTGSMKYFRPFDNGAINSFSINGGRSSMNEYQIDGTPNNYGNNIAYVPPAEAVQEFKIQTNTYDAQFGRTGGGVINMSMKSGTNQFHGAGYEYLRRTDLNANTIQSNKAGTARTDQPVDQYGFQLGGPVWLPKVYKGKDRTFFMVAVEHYRDRNPQPVVTTVPTIEQKKGDFSQTYTSSGKLYTIYDPYSVHINPNYDPAKSVSVSNAQYIRDPFPGNQVPVARWDKVGANLAKLLPDPNQTGNAVTHANNFFGANAAELNSFNNLAARVDHSFNDQWKTFVRWYYNNRDLSRPMGNYDWGGTAADPAMYSYRKNHGATADVVGTLSPRTVINFRAAFTLHNPYTQYVTYDQAQLGFSDSYLHTIRGSQNFPSVGWENYSSPNHSGWSTTTNPYYTYTPSVSVLRTQGSHSMKFGVELRQSQNANSPWGGSAWGSYNFSRSFTSYTPQTNDPNSGNAIASMLLGTLNSGSAGYEYNPFQSQKYWDTFFQDSWQVTRRLTLSLGLRWDYEAPPVERYNRQTRGFDYDATSPIQIPGYSLKGGLLFAGVNGVPGTALNPDKNNVQPRFGLAYKMTDSKPLVFRGGFGLYYLPQYMQMNGSTGFSQGTSVQTITADYRPLNTFSNPLPDGLLQPVGASAGLASGVGDGIGFGDVNSVVPKMWQYSAGFQYELFPGLLIDASYVGSQTDHLQVGQQLDYLTADQLAQGTSYLSTVVTNPFYGVLSSKTSLGSQKTIQLRKLLTAYPQFTSLNRNNASLGGSWYNAFQLRIERRLKDGLWLLANYTASKNMETMSYKNNGPDKDLSREFTSWDIPQRLTLSGIYEFPIGPQKKYLNSGIASHVIGGWQFNWNVILQSGFPMDLPSGYVLTGDPRLTSGQSMSHWFNTSASLWHVQAPDTLRTIPFYSPNLRYPTAPNVDITLVREFRIHENHKLQVKASAFNLTNTPLMQNLDNSPSSTTFGQVQTSQNNLPRNIEIGFRYSF